MAKYITASGAQSVGSQVGGLFIQVNAALTGTLTVTAAGSTQYGTAAQTIAIITNPTVGSQFRYGGLHTYGTVSINPSTTCDITATILSRIV